MDKLNKERKKHGLVSVKPCDVFDLIGGTSTGGLIAILLGRLQMDVDACITAYSKLAGDVFRKKKWTFPLTTRGKFDTKRLETAVKSILKERGISEDALFNDQIDRKVKTFVCAMDFSTTETVLIRDYEGISGIAVHCSSEHLESFFPILREVPPTLNEFNESHQLA